MPVKDPYMLSLPPLWKGQAKDIAQIMSDRRPETARPASMADAIRYAIAFTHKQLTEVLNPEDLRDDG